MKKICPLLKIECMENKCAWWGKAKNENCVMIDFARLYAERTNFMKEIHEEEESLRINDLL